MNTEKSSIENYLSCLDKVLFSAVKHGHLPRVQSLIENGADIDIFDSEGRSLSAIALQHGHTGIVDYLAECSE